MCGVWLLCLVWIGHPENDLLKALWSQTMAAWVQAVGSVLAILSALQIATAQDRRARELHMAERIDFKRRSARAVEVASWQISANTQAVVALGRAGKADARSIAMHRDTLDAALVQLRAIHAGDLPSRDWTIPIINLTSAAQGSSATMALWLSDREIGPDSFDHVLPIILEATQQIGRLSAQLDT